MKLMLVDGIECRTRRNKVNVRVARGGFQRTKVQSTPAFFTSMCAKTTSLPCAPKLLHFHVRQNYFTSMCAKTTSLPCAPKLLHFHVRQNYFTSMCAKTTSLPCVPKLLHFHVCQNYFTSMCAKTTSLPCVTKVLTDNKRYEKLLSNADRSARVII